MAEPIRRDMVTFKLQHLGDPDAWQSFVAEVTRAPINRALIRWIDDGIAPTGLEVALVDKLVDVLDRELNYLLAMYPQHRIAMWLDDVHDQRGLAVDDYVVFIARTEYRRAAFDPDQLWVDVIPDRQPGYLPVAAVLRG